MKIVEKLPFYNSLVLPVHYVQAFGAGMRYGWPARKMRVIGVTGTNGKTTTCFMIWKMLSEAGYKTGLMTTVGWGGLPGVKGVEGEKADREGVFKQVEHMTTADSFTLNRRMWAIREAGAEFLVLEVTSHAMVQFRTLGVPIEIAVMTNVTHEHLDYHKTFERYVEAKCRLFKKARYGVINADDKSWRKFAAAVSGSDCAGACRIDGEKYITYGIKNGKKRAFDVKLAVSGVNYACDDINVKTKIPGEFNVYNSLAALCVGEKLGLEPRQIEKGVGALESVEGRMNRVNEGQNFEVIVDYAHTPDALEKVFSSISTSSSRPVRGSRTESTPALRASASPSANTKKGASAGRVIAVHGGAGRRDESTRAMRGEILAKRADVVIITEDDSRDEDPAKIAEQFVEGAVKAGAREGENLFVELNREKAIGLALGMAKKGDLVLLLGKGHEKTILRADGAHAFEDLKVARKLLKRMRKGK